MPEDYNRRVLETLTRIQKDVAEIKANMGTRFAPPRPQNSGEEIADDRDLDGSHGNPVVKFDPKAKYWQGESFVACTFSECSPEYLDAMAKYLDACAYMAAKDTDEKKRNSAKYKAKDAARARGWAQRIRNGWQGQATAQSNVAPPDDFGGYGGVAHADDDIPF